jgi:DNA-binding beta-propeller fold protein YncE
MTWLLVCLVGFWGKSGARENLPSTLVFPTFRHTWGIRKATSVHLFMFVGLRTRFDDPQGLAAVRLHSWDDPLTEDDDDELVVYGVNSGENNIIWNTSMTSVGVFGDDLLKEPRGIAADQAGHVWVADTGHHRIVHLFNPGDRLIYRGDIGHWGTGPGQFRYPSDLAIDSRGRLYVTDTGNSRIQIFDGDGRLLSRIEDGLNGPEGIAVIDAGERWSYYRDTFLCVVDHGGRRLVKLSTVGELLRVADERQTSWQRASYEYPAIDYYGNIWVTDGENHCIHKFDRHLNYVVSFGRRGGGDGEFQSPRGLAVWRRFGQVFVAEQSGAQYYWIGVDLLDVGIEPDLSGEGFQIHFFLTERAYVSVEVRDDREQVVGVLMANRQQSIGPHNVRWDGRGSGARTLSEGWYTVRITAEPTYSSYHYFQKVVNRRVKLG